TVPIYTTQSVDQIQFILKDSGARALLISGGRVLRRAREGFESSEHLENVIVFDSESAEGLERAITLESIEVHGAGIERDDPQAFERLIARGSGDDLATLIYTSGTPGESKGVVLKAHMCIAYVSWMSTSCRVYLCPV